MWVKESSLFDSKPDIKSATIGQQKEQNIIKFGTEWKIFW